MEIKNVSKNGPAFFGDKITPARSCQFLEKSIELKNNYKQFYPCLVKFKVAIETVKESSLGCAVYCFSCF